MARMPTRPPADGPRDWRELLSPLVADLSTPSAPLGIGIELLTGFGGFGFSRFGVQAAEIQDVRDGLPLAPGIRPLRRANGSDRWVRGNLTWRTFRYGGAGNSGPLGEFAAEQVDLLGRLVRLQRAEQQFGMEPGDTMRLDEFRGTEGWALLDRARAAGIELVGTGIVEDVEWGAPARMRLDVQRADGDLLLTAQAEVGGQVRTDLRAAGAGGFLAVEPGKAAGRVHVTLLPAADPIAPVLKNLLAAGEPVRIPRADAAEFLADHAPLLRDRVTLTSHDRSVEIPEWSPPRLHLEVRHDPAGAAALTWSWTYRAPRRTVSLSDARPRDDREAEHLGSVLAAARRVWPSSAEHSAQRLEDAEAASFVEHELPRLVSLPDVDVTEHGQRPDYTEISGTPSLRIVQVDPPKAHVQDWLGLGFEITLGEHLVPFTAIFAALSQGKKSVLLPDKTYFRLDHPMFERLREVLDEASRMDEWEPGAPSIPRTRVDLWEEFEDLADETVEAVSWRESVGRLRDLATIPRPDAPAGLAATLRPYQAEGYAWLSFLADHRLGGILADDMGLGKTLQALAAIVRRRGIERAADPAAPPHLVVAPSSVMGIWRREAERFAPGLDVRVLDTTSGPRGTSAAEARTGADVVVTSYALLRLDEAEFTALDWSGLILDEAQFVKNPRSRAHLAAKAVRAPFRVAITGTPLENSLMDLWALLALTAPGLFASQRAFRERFIRPIEQPDDSESGQRRARERMALLRRRIRPFVLRRTKDVVAPELPERIEQVLTVPLQAGHRALYERILQRERQKLLGLVHDIDRHRFIVFRSITLLRMLALDPAIVAPEHAGVASSKLDALLEHLDEVLAEHHRVLVFSQFTSHLQHVADRLRERGVAFSYLDGSTTGREEVVAQFRDGAAPVFLISLKAGGFGLTLTEADYVFLLDPWWNPAAEAQAVDRAHRIGQTRPVMVYRMVAEGTIEEKVLALQERKRALFTSLTDDDQAFAAALTADDVRELVGG